MKKLLFFTGNADSSFVKNEIGFLKDFFDDICLISYPIPEELFQKILISNGIRGYIIPKWKLSLKFIKDYIKWIFLDHVRKEIRNYTSLSIKGIKRFLYICYYGLYAVRLCNTLEGEICNKTDNSDIYLYAFWMSRPAYMAAFLRYIYKEKIRRTVTRAHGYDLYEEQGSTDYLPFRQFISDNMDQIHFISDNGREYYNSITRRKYHLTKIPILSLNYLGTYNITHFKKNIKDKQKVVIASCAYVTTIKRLDLIINFLSILEGISIKWIHIGDGKMLNNIKTFAQKEIPYIDMHFYGNVKNERILSIYEKEDVDFLINMSDSEGLPVSIMEAMSIGVPVIARKVGGIGEIVNEKNGCLLDGIGVAEKEKFKQFVTMRIANIPRYRTFSENAVRTWEDKYNAESNYRKFCEEIVDSQ